MNTATHESPVWQKKANFVIVADLSEYGLAGRWEQLWAREVAASEFEVCCIPFFTYGLALGDIVTTKSAGGKEHVIAAVKKSGGRQVLRAWIKNGTAAGKERIYQYLARSRPLHEWSSDNLVAIDVPDPDTRQELLSLVDELNQQAIECEWAG